ncbi:LamG-like jellyroll fold domain-containing protein [Curtobacterium sp. VKM Ac-1393]|uniref:LamG-like jellyroll fold domain-containing protein n=1 Tax=Curtobacterium sp. VKM Ac-1393 TaxID=2783814 RepID=UPI00188A812A|nr:LamG-like jellyroll fold domain-containing protein [Curtobacterium sp. VKM Ac-1393]MBF4607947.1 metallophosphoesterase [Curtobacterium sp. VKM Ac-1393]
MQNSPRPDRTPVSRRGFLVGSGLAGAAGIAGASGLGVAPAAADALSAPAARPSDPTEYAAQSVAARGHAGRWRPDTASPRFTVAVMPDTQYMFDGAAVDQAPMRASLEYVVREQVRHNTVFLVHLGDLTQNGAASEMRASGEVFEVLDRAGAPYSVLAGNHDVDSSTDDQRGRTPYLDVFGPQRFRKAPGWIGASPDGYNSAHRFTAGGREWVVLALDWRTSASGLAWASSVLAARPHAPVILTTHAIVDSDPGGGAAFDPYGQQLWDSFITKHDQVFLTLNGHYWGPGRTTARNAAGHDVALHLTNYQNRYYGGAAMIRLYHVDLERNVIDVETLSPFLLAGGLGDANELAAQEFRLSGDVDRFTMAVDFDARFAGFAPVAPRASRPAARMLVPGTLAYWRFDGNADGAALVPTTRVHDQSGRGNDLVVAGRSGAVAGALRWSAGHHPDQPGAGSLALQGGKSGGDHLQTVPTAPLNRTRFPRGYTVEAFFALPTTFDPSTNGFSALLSQYSSAGQVGKATVAGDGDGDPAEPAVTLSLSGDRELQWCVYPASQDGSLTNWGHELPLGAWWHVAVVNDGAHTVLYVDGCPVVRNPSTRNHGLSTIGKPWLLGGYRYGDALDNVFVGSIGDVRIVGRALRPSEFMNA